MHTAIKKSSLIVASFMAGMAYLVACGPLDVTDASAEERRGTPFVAVQSDDHQLPYHPCSDSKVMLVRGPALIRVFSKNLAIARVDESNCGHSIEIPSGEVRWEPQDGLLLPEGYAVIAYEDNDVLVAGEQL